MSNEIERLVQGWVHIHLVRMDHGVPWLTQDKIKKGPWKRMRQVKGCTASVSQEVDGGSVCHGHL